uniref:Uncharacterized protein n=1 Tax=Glossina pallidipes TaxID=7398 RepID=A0A1A9ZVU2_GLOPL
MRASTSNNILAFGSLSPVCHKLFRNFGPGPETLSTNLICMPGSPDARNGFECQYIKSPSASSSQLSPMPSLSPSSCPELGISGQLSRRQCKSEQAALLSQIVPSGHISAKGTHCEVPFAV